jgi:hypothetical protein
VHDPEKVDSGSGSEDHHNGPFDNTTQRKNATEGNDKFSLGLFLTPMHNTSSLRKAHMVCKALCA